MWIAAWRPDGIAPWSLVFAFAAFRLLDIVKPFPIGKLESAGDWGIVLDDAAAGAIALGLGLLLDHFFALMAARPRNARTRREARPQGQPGARAGDVRAQGRPQGADEPRDEVHDPGRRADRRS